MNLVQYIVHLAVIIVHKNSSIHGQGYHFDVRPFCWTGLTYLDSGLRRSAGIANGQQMVQWTFAVSDSPWAELRSLLRSAGWRICQRWCLLTRTLFWLWLRPACYMAIPGSTENLISCKREKGAVSWRLQAKSKVGRFFPFIQLCFSSDARSLLA